MVETAFLQQSPGYGHCDLLGEEAFLELQEGQVVTNGIPKSLKFRNSRDTKGHFLVLRESEKGLKHK